MRYISLFCRMTYVQILQAVSYYKSLLIMPKLKKFRDAKKMLSQKMTSSRSIF